MGNILLWDIAKFVLVIMAVKIFAPSLFQALNDFYDVLKKAFK